MAKFVSLLTHQIKVTWVTEDWKEQSTSFRHELLAKCQRAFEKDKKDDEERERTQSSIKEAETVSFFKTIKHNLLYTARNLFSLTT